MDQPLDNRVVVVVGGTSGLGLAGARACLRAGARAVAVGRKPETCAAAEAALGAGARALAADAGDPQTAVRAIALAREAFGRFDALYHVAGGSGRALGDGPLHACTDEGIAKTLAWNLASVMYSNRAAVRAFLDAGTPGVVLNMGSVLGFSPAPHHFATHAYAGAKAGIAGFTKSCAAYYAPRGIRFNVVAPALVDTPMARRAAGDEAIAAYLRTKQPLDGGRIGAPEDLDGAVVFLLSDQSRTMTGQVVVLDRGWCVSEGQHGAAP